MDIIEIESWSLDYSNERINKNLISESGGKLIIPNNRLDKIKLWLWEKGIIKRVK